MMGFKKCPLCGAEYVGKPATSRTIGGEEICSDCGTKQALNWFCMRTGRTNQTEGIYNFIHINAQTMEFVLKSLERHFRFDWGDVCEQDAHTNDLATVDVMCRLVSSYDIPKHLQTYATDNKIWIITESADELYETTVLFPSEY